MCEFLLILENVKGRLEVANCRGKFANSIHVIVSLLNLEGDCRKDRVRQCLLLRLIKKVHTRNCSLKQNLNYSSKVANRIIVDTL